ncbi:Cyclin [Macleaya cordata]|uniref:Cyclin n=1 Tax=Macleaya cordata TaxID=56857 RepID=A0A200QG14_MACCD|nr:Cyclin [Macleaya cordata]
MEDSASSFSLSSLLCKENEACFNEEDDDDEEVEVKEDLFINLNNYGFLESDDEYIKMLVERENNFGTKNEGSLDDCSTMTQDWFKCARLDAIRWILKTRAFFGFRLQTAYLSLTYFDRFLSKRAIDGEKLWAIRLLSVACLSLAAKMEECSVPTLSEFQIEEYNFESKVIQRMELLVLNTLEWRMDSITPFAYFHYFITKFNDESQPPKDLVSKISELILATIKEVNSMDHPPSSIAAAAVLAALDKNLTRKMLELKMSSISSCGSLENEHVFSCYNLMQVLEIEKSKIPKFVISPDLSSIYSSSTDVLEDSSITSASRTKRRKITLGDYDQNCGMINEKGLH